MTTTVQFAKKNHWKIGKNQQKNQIKKIKKCWWKFSGSHCLELLSQCVYTAIDSVLRINSDDFTPASFHHQHTAETFG